MKKRYFYDGQEYDSEFSVKQAIFEKTRLAFGPEPDEGKVEFWAQYDVTYTEELPPKPTVDELKTAKLIDLNEAQSFAEQGAYIKCSLGFTIDANETANRNLEGLLYTTGEGQTVYFCDRDNNMQPVTREQLETMRKEVIQNGQYIYTQKWTMRTAIEQATTEEELNAIEIKFEYMDYTQK